MILHIENPKHSAKKLLEKINKCNKGARYKVNVQKFVAFLYGNSELAKVKFMQQPHL